MVFRVDLQEAERAPPVKRAQASVHDSKGFDELQIALVDAVCDVRINEGNEPGRRQYGSERSLEVGSIP
jgi:hypothetical protein